MEFSRVQFLRQDVEGLGVCAEVGYVEDGFGVREIETCEIIV